MNEHVNKLIYRKKDLTLIDYFFFTLGLPPFERKKDEIAAKYPEKCPYILEIKWEVIDL